MDNAQLSLKNISDIGPIFQIIISLDANQKGYSELILSLQNKVEFPTIIF